MPNGRTHDFITLATAAAGTPLALNSGLPDTTTTTVGVLVGAYLLSGLLFSPDLDLKSTPYRRWRMLRFVWIPYQRMVPHRSWISHSFLLGPLLRVLYFAVVMAVLTLIVLGLVRLLVPFDPTGSMYQLSLTAAHWIQFHPVIILYAVVGFVLGGAAHTLADLIWSGVKRRVRRMF